MKVLSLCVVASLLVSCSNKTPEPVKSVVEKVEVEKAPQVQEKPVVYQNDFSGKALGEEWIKAFTGPYTKFKNGSFEGGIKPKAKHSAIYLLTLKPYKNIEFEIDFKMNGAEWFKINIRDKGYEETHAGHIARLFLYPDKIRMQDCKYGWTNHALKRKAKKEKDKAAKAILDNSIKDVPHKFEQDKWYKLKMTIVGETMTAYIDGKKAAEFTSKGFAHDNKIQTSLGVKEQSVFFDNLIIR